MRKFFTVAVVVPVLALGSFVMASSSISAADRNAAPPGTTKTATVNAWGSGASEYGTSALYDVKMTLLEIVRGDEAWRRIEAGSPVSKPPVAGFEYVLARIRLACFAPNGTPGTVPYTLKPDDLKVYSRDNQAYDPPAASPPEPELLGKVIYPGDTREGWVVFSVAKDHRKPLLFFSSGLWFQLYNQ